MERCAAKRLRTGWVGSTASWLAANILQARIFGDMEQDIWYDDNDVPVKFIHSKGEDRVTFTLL